MLNRPWIILAALLLIVVVLWSQRPPASGEVARTALIMGTLVEIKAVGPDKNKLEDAISDAFSAMRTEEARFSPAREDSQIAALNRATSPVTVDSEVIDLLQRGEKIRRDSQGAFNMGLGGVKALWDIEGENPRVPTAAELRAVLPDPTQPVVEIAGTRVMRRSSRVQLDLGGIAKGYAVDRALTVLRRAGLTSASINAGGDIGLLGGHGDRSWKIGIQHPRRSGELLATIELRDRAIVTSGDYERFFLRDGVRYHHIFDPQTGEPARGCQSVSVVADNVADADALATAAFVLGPEAGLKLLERRPGVEGLIVAADGSSQLTSGLKGRIAWR